MSKRTQTEAPALFSTPFSPAYWREAAKDCKNLRKLTLAALLCALTIVIEKFQIPLGSQGLYVSLSFPVIALCSMLTGPLLAIACGILVDLIGAIGIPNPFPGYTLTAVLTAVVYALFLYRVRPTFTRILLAKGLINIFVNTLLGSVWRILLNGGTYGFWVVLSGIKNLLLLPVEVFLLCIFFRAMQKPLQQLNLLSTEVDITYRNRNFIILVVVSVVCAALIVPFSLWYTQIKDFLRGIL